MHRFGQYCQRLGAFMAFTGAVLLVIAPGQQTNALIVVGGMLLWVWLIIYFVEDRPFKSHNSFSLTQFLPNQPNLERHYLNDPVDECDLEDEYV